jgi:hypothetical protein
VKVQAKSCAASRSSCCKRRAKEVVLLGSRPCHLGDGRHREDAMKTGAFTRLAILSWWAARPTARSSTRPAERRCAGSR